MILILWYLLFFVHFSHPFRLKLQDFFAAHSFYLFNEEPPQAQDIIIVTIDEESRRRLKQRWPWPRSVTAQLINTIASFSPRVIGLDIIFSGTTEPADDQALAETFARTQNVVLGYILRQENSELPLDMFGDSVAGLGFVNRPVQSTSGSGLKNTSDVYNVVRNIRTFYQRETGPVDVSIDIALVSRYRDVSEDEIRIMPSRGIYLGDELFIPSPGGIASLDYLVHPLEFKQIPAYLVLEGAVDAEDFRDKIVLVGATDPLIHDEHITPLGIYPGVTIIANALVMILTERFLVSVLGWPAVAAFFMLGLGILIVNKHWGFLRASAVTVSLLLVLFFAALYGRARSIQFDYFSLFYFCVSAYLVSNVYKYTYLMYMRNKLKNLAVSDALTRFYTYRYFLAKVDEDFKDTSKTVIFCAFRLTDYNKLSFELHFKRLQSLIQTFSHYFRVQWEKKLKNVMFFRLAQDVIALTIVGAEKDYVEELSRNFLAGVRQVEFEIEKEKYKVNLQGVFIAKLKGQKVKSKEVISTMEKFIRKFPKGGEEDLVITDVQERIWEEAQQESGQDIMDFLEVDLKERNRELEQMVEEVIEAKKDVEKSYLEVIRCLIKALEEKDTYTEGHSERVARYSVAIAQESGAGEEECAILYKAALLHDIGKIGIPDFILHKKERLTDDDYALIKRHPLTGVDILRPFKPFENLLQTILYHHERWDGTGYPHGISGEKIPEGAQILAIADSYDAITCGRGYKKGTPPQEALGEIVKNSGSQFSPQYVEIFRRAFEKNPANF